MASRLLIHCASPRCLWSKCLISMSFQALSKHQNITAYQRRILFSCYEYSTSHVEAVKNLQTPKRPNSTPENMEKLTIKGMRVSEDFDEITAAELAKNSDPDSFGTLDPQKTKELTYDQMLDQLPEEEGDKIVTNFLDPETQRRQLRMTEYIKMIRSLIKERKIREAIDVLEVRMLKEDRVKPTYQVYNQLISACGHAGYTKKAFKLYNDMKKRGLRPTSGTFTSLFNACANCPFPGYGLEQAKLLKTYLDDKSLFIQPITYHAMIKAFGRCGDSDVAFSLVDEMMERKLPLSAVTFCFLLQACISDREAGFRHALLVWHKLRRKWIKPSLYSYNLLLRTVRECGTGDYVAFQQMIDQVIKEGVRSPEEHKVLTAGTSATLSGSSGIQTTEMPASSTNHSEEPPKPSDEITVAPTSELDTTTEENLIENRPNLLTYKPHLGSIIAIEEVKTPQDRLILLGGVHGVLKEMENDGLQPNSITFGLLLECIPGTLTAERALLSVIKAKQVALDTSFYNILIKKRAMRFDYESARDVLTIMRQHNAQPDIMTFGALALSCKRNGEAQDLLNLMKEAEFHPNIEILGAMMRHACNQYSFGYIVYLMKYVKEEEIEVNKMFLKHLQDFHTKCIDSFKALHKNMKKKEDVNVPDFFSSTTFQESFTMFQKFYKFWLKTVKVEPDVHPWNEVKKERKNHQ